MDSEAPEQILVTGDDQYGFGCVHGDFPIGTTAGYIRKDIHEAEIDRLWAELHPNGIPVSEIPPKEDET